MTSGFARKEMHFDFLVNFGHFGVFHRHKQLFTVQKCEKVLLESKTVCWFEVFKEGIDFTVFCSSSRNSKPKILNGRNVHGPYLSRCIRWHWRFHSY